MKAYREDGGVIIENFLPPDRVERLNAELEPYMKKQNPGSSSDNAGLQIFHGAQTKRLTNLVPRCKTWREEVCDDDLPHAISDLVFTKDCGCYWQATAQVIEIGPGNPAQVLHHDFSNIPIHNFTNPDAPEALLNFLVALTDTTEENGATRVIPGSHKWTDVHDMGDPSMTIGATLKAGDCLLIGGRVLHGGGANVSDESRRIVAWSFIPGYITPEEAHPLLIPLEMARGLSERAQRTLGFRSQYTAGAGLWTNDLEDIARSIDI